MIRWVLVGVIVAPFSFILFWLVPKKILGFPLIPEWMMLLLTTLAPISFYISIFKYRFFKIDVILSRSTVYSAVVVVVISIYIILQKLIEYFILLSKDLDMLMPVSLSSIIHSPNLPVLISFVIIFLFYGTLKQKFQNFVDRRLFSETFKRKEANEIFSEKLKTFVTTEGIGNLTFTSLYDTLLADKLGVVIYDLDNNEVIFSRFSAHLSVPLEFNEIIIKEMRTKPLRVSAIDGAIEDGYTITSADESIAIITGINVFLFSYSNDRSKVLLVVFGENRRRFKYSHEEIEAALYKTDHAISNINRLFIMSHLNLKEKENRRLEELNEMKSFFISSVTHELKTPLTSIKIFAELMQGTQDIPNEMKNKYLEIIQNECSRLNNLINNVLDFSKIERGVKEYNFSNVDFVTIIDLVMVMMQFQFEKNGFKVEREIGTKTAIIKADKDALTEVIINLLSNSMKYSENEKHITVKLQDGDGHYVFSVEDRGNGISEHDLDHIFDAFYRAESVKRGPSGGTGIGLSLVKNIIDAHKGEIEVESELGKGTIVKIYIPKGN